MVVFFFSLFSSTFLGEMPHLNWMEQQRNWPGVFLCGCKTNRSNAFRWFFSDGFKLNKKTSKRRCLQMFTNLSWIERLSLIESLLISKPKRLQAFLEIRLNSIEFPNLQINPSMVYAIRRTMFTCCFWRTKNGFTVHTEVQSLNFWTHTGRRIRERRRTM